MIPRFGFVLGSQATLSPRAACRFFYASLDFLHNNKHRVKLKGSSAWDQTNPRGSPRAQKLDSRLTDQRGCGSGPGSRKRKGWLSSGHFFHFPTFSFESALLSLRWTCTSDTARRDHAIGLSVELRNCRSPDSVLLLPLTDLQLAAFLSSSPCFRPNLTCGYAARRLAFGTIDHHLPKLLCTRRVITPGLE